MQFTADFFSILYFIFATIYAIFGVYVFSLNKKAAINRVFFLVCLSLSIWGLGRAVSNTLINYEKVLFWRRVAALGWGTVYSFLFHFFLILTNRKKLLKNKSVYVLIYLPALVNIIIYSLYSPIATNQFNLLRLNTGWISVSTGSFGYTYFNIYYLLYSLAAVIALWTWDGVFEDSKKKKTALLLSFSYLLVIISGSLTDIFINSYTEIRLPQLGIIFAFIPIIAIFYSIKKHGVLLKNNKQEIKREGEFFYETDRIKFYKYLSWAFIIGSYLNFGHYFYYSGELYSVILFSSSLLTIGLFFRLIFMTSLETEKQNLIMALLLSFSILFINFYFQLVYSNHIVWTISLMFMLLAAVFREKRLLITITLISIFTQIASWLIVPELTLQIKFIDYIVRIVFLLLGAFLAYYVNHIYVQRLLETEKQSNLQHMLFEISSYFFNVSSDNFDEIINHVLEKSSLFFQADRSYLLTMSEGFKVSKNKYQWCNSDIKYVEDEIDSVSNTDFFWCLEELKKNNAVNISSRKQDISEFEKEFLNGRKIKSFLAFPIMIKGQLFGILGFEFIRPTKWRNKQSESIQIITNLISEALLKIDKEREIEHLAYYDSLTDLANRTLFNKRLEDTIFLAERKEKYIGLLFLDLDSFKDINDTLGHESGDELLVQVANRLKNKVRKYDTVCRFGGDEFIVMFPHMDQPKDIKEAGEKVMKVFNEPMNLAGQEIFVSASGGVSVYPVDGDNAESLIKNSDMAMYKAKEQGKNQITFCTSFMKEDVEEKIKLTNQLYRALEREELVLHYQPQVSVSSNKIIGLEALLRWQHPEKGMIYPDKIIPLAEQKGLINPIGKWVLETACVQNKAWQKMGLPHVNMAVNLSPEQFRDSRLVNMVSSVLKETGLAASYLELEITESIARQKGNYIINILQDLKSLGVNIAIDDFGTEYSSLSRLKELPIDRLKMAMEFVHGIDRGFKEEAIAKVIINLAKSLNLRIIAEGVETETQQKFLADRTCDEIQGFYFYKPMPAKDIEKLMREKMN